jgi:hypothetical protein
MMTKDDGYIVIANSKSLAVDDSIKKIASDMKPEWQLNFDGSTASPELKNWSKKDEFVRSVIELKDGGYIAVGGTSVENTRSDRALKVTAFRDIPFVLKFDSNGNVLWRKDWLHSSGEFSDIAMFIEEKFLVCGTKVLDYKKDKRKGIAAEYDNRGNMRWAYEFPDMDGTYRILAAKDGTILAFGGTHHKDSDSAFNRDISVVKFMPSGQIMWNHIYKLSDGLDFISKAIELKDGSMVIAGPIIIGAERNTMFIASISGDGILQWKNLIAFNEGGAFLSLNCPEIYDLIQLPTGEFYVLGSAEEGRPLGFLLKLDATGKKIWTKPTLKDGKRYRFQKIERNGDGTLKLTGLLEEDPLRDQIHSINLSPNGDSAQ